MPSEELTYRHSIMDKINALEKKTDLILVQTTETNGKVRKITIGLVALGFFCLGLGLEQLAPVLKLFL